MHDILRMRRSGLWALGMALIAVVAWGVGSKPAEAANDSKISTVTIVSSTSSAVAATSSYDIQVVTSETLASGSPISFEFSVSSFDAGQFNLSNATMSRVSGNNVVSLTAQTSPTAIMGTLPVQLTAGTYTFRIGNVANPSKATAYNIFVSTSQQQEGQGPGDQPPSDPGVPGVPQGGQETSGTPSGIGVIGSSVLYGVFTQSNGTTPIANTGVNVSNENFTVHRFGNTNGAGSYSIDIAGLSGAFKLDAFLDPRNAPAGQTAPEPVRLTLSGTTVRQDLKTQVASKTLSVTVEYSTGGAVTDADVNAFQPGGGQFANSTVDSQGKATISLSKGGTWEVNVNPAFDPQTGQPKSVDWTQQFGQITQVTFKEDTSTETQSVTMKVSKASSKIKGKVVDSDGKVYTQGSVDMRSADGQGSSTGIQNDGSFQVNVQPGNYEVSVWTNNSQLYSDFVKVTVEADQTVDLGTIKLKKRNSKITGTVTLKDTGAAVEGVRVRAFQVGGGFGWGDDQTDSNGVWEIPVNPGKWGIQIDNWKDPNSSAKSYTPESNEPIEIEVKDNETVSGKNFKVSELTGTIVMTLVAADGASLTNKWYGADCHVAGLPFGPGNNYFGGFQNAKATIPVKDNATYECQVHMPPNETDYSLDKAVTVVVGNDASVETTVTLVKNDAKIKGKLKDQSGKAVTGIFARVFAESRTATGGFGGFREADVNQSDGSYEISVRSGTDKEYHLGFFAGFMGPGDPGKGGGEGDAGNLIPTPPSFEGLAVPTAGDYPYDIIANRSDATIRGRVVDDSGAPVAFAFVFANNSVEFRDEEGPGGEKAGAFAEEPTKRIDTGTQTDQNGNYNLGVVGGQEYFVGTGLPHFLSGKNLMPPEGQHFTIATGETKTADFQFGKADATINMTVNIDTGGTLPFGYCHGYNIAGQFSGGEVFGGTSSIAVTSGSDWYIQCDGNQFGSNEFYRSAETIVDVKAAGTYAQTITVSKTKFEIPDSVTTSFDGSQQASVKLPDGTELTIPAGATTTKEETMTLIAEPTTQVNTTKDDAMLTYAWDYTLTDENGTEVSSFNSNIVISSPYDETLVEEAGINEEELIIKYNDPESNTWQVPSSYTLDTKNDLLTSQTDHFTEFAVVGTASGSAASVPDTTVPSQPADEQAGEGASHHLVVTPASSGGPQVVRITKDGEKLASWFAFSSTLRMGVDTVVADMDGDGEEEILAMPSSKYPSQIRRFNKDGNVLTQWTAYPAGYKNGIYAAASDTDGDGDLELITVPKTGASAHVKVWDRSGTLLTSFNAFGSYTGGALVTTSDLTGDGTVEIIVGQRTGGSQIKVFTKDGDLLTLWNAFPGSYKGGLGSLRVSDLDGNGDVEILASQAVGGSQVRIFDHDGDLLTQFNAYGSGFKKGVKMVVGDTDGDGDKDIATMPNGQATSQFRVFTKDGAIQTQGFAFGSTSFKGYNLLTGDLDGDGDSELVVAVSDSATSYVKTVDSVTGQVLSSFRVFGSKFAGGANIKTMTD